MVSIALAAPAIKWTMSDVRISRNWNVVECERRTNSTYAFTCIVPVPFTASHRKTRNAPLVHYSVVVNLIAKTAIGNPKIRHMIFLLP